RRPLPGRQLRPHARLPRPDRPGRGGDQAPILPAARAGQPAVPPGRPVPEDRAVTDPTVTVVPDPPASLLVPLGRVAAPPEREATSGTFYFWVDRDQSVERTQIVSTRSTVAGRTVRFVGVVQEVYRRSRQKDVHEEAARYDTRTAERPPF